MIILVSDDSSDRRSRMKTQFDAKRCFTDLVDQFPRLFGQFQRQTSDDLHLIQSERILHIAHFIVETVVQRRTSRARTRLNNVNRLSFAQQSNEHLWTFDVVEIVLEFPRQSCRRNQLWFRPEDQRRMNNQRGSSSDFEDVVFVCALIEETNHLIDRVNDFRWT